MIIYLDLLIGTTFLVNYSFIKTISITFKNKINVRRILMSSFIATISLLFFIIPISFVWQLRHLYGIIIGLIAFNDKSKINRLIKITTFYLLNYAFIGTLAVFNIKNSWLLLVVLFYLLVLYMIERFSIIYKKMKINCTLDKQKLVALIDTGNQCYYQGLPVTFIDNEYKTGEFILIGEMLTKSVYGEVLVDVYIGPKLIILGEEKDTYFAFMNIDGFDLIVNQEIGGIK